MTCSSTPLGFGRAIAIRPHHAIRDERNRTPSPTFSSSTRSRDDPPSPPPQPPPSPAGWRSPIVGLGDLDMLDGPLAPLGA